MMTRKTLIGLGILVAAGVATSTTASAAGAGASARAHMNIKANPLVESVALRPNGIRRSLRARGYYNIHFTDRHLPVYKVRACKNGKRFNVRLNRWGDIRRRTRVGRCGNGHAGPRLTGLSFPEIRRKLRNRGYYRINFTDRRLPGYRARVCRGGKRYNVYLNRWGRVMDRQRRGWCGFAGHGPRRGGYVNYDGPGFSITLGGRRHR